jgi:general secretion pathway protein M
MAHRQPLTQARGRMMSQLRNLIQSLPEKDRKLIQYLALAMAFSLLWFWNIAPALKTYQEAPLQLAQLERQTENLKALQAQALALQKAPRVKVQSVGAVLQQSSTEILGNGAKLNLEASRATLTLNNVSAEALAQFLTAARTQAQAMPIEAKLQKNKTGNVEVWRGTLILSLHSQS